LSASEAISAQIGPSFKDLGLSAPVLAALADVGYESPSPIQAATIPVLLGGADMLGQAQTGTGKTAAFALPILTRIKLAQRSPQVLVLVPTRELAIQVAEAFQRYAAHLKGFHVLPVYGGQGYGAQLHGLQRGVHVIVGTPGRVMDHMNRGTLQLAELTTLVLDEADEMLRMGFIDAVQWILEQTPATRQTALFSATLPPAIRRIAQRHLRTPREVTIRSRTSTVVNTRQRYWVVSGLHKLDALTRILEAERFEAMLVFTRTKQGTVELAERLQARGFAAAALNGDMPQRERERTIARLKDGQIDLLVATDVAARGLDVERISHVVNYDIPTDPEAYIHRIGRTGRAGRSGEAILFVAPRERAMLRVIESATRQHIEPMLLPSIDDVNEQRLARFRQRVVAALGGEGGSVFRTMIEQISREHGASPLEIAAALATLLQGDTPLLLSAQAEHAAAEEPPAPASARATQHAARPPARASGRAVRVREPAHQAGAPTLATYRIEIGRTHGIKPGQIVGAIANEAGLAGAQIGRIDIREAHSLIDLPAAMPRATLRSLARVRVAGELLRLTREDARSASHAGGATQRESERTRVRRWDP
jgi:ATP-dependent RNA helicase DeaD